MISHCLAKYHTIIELFRGNVFVVWVDSFTKVIECSAHIYIFSGFGIDYCRSTALPLLCPE
nr:hypothetical protein [Methanobrevibacter sp.]